MDQNSCERKTTMNLNCNYLYKMQSDRIQFNGNGELNYAKPIIDAHKQKLILNKIVIESIFG